MIQSATRARTGPRPRHGRRAGVRVERRATARPRRRGRSPHAAARGQSRRGRAPPSVAPGQLDEALPLAVELGDEARVLARSRADRLDARARSRSRSRARAPRVASTRRDLAPPPAWPEHLAERPSDPGARAPGRSRARAPPGGARPPRGRALASRRPRARKQGRAAGPARPPRAPGAGEDRGLRRGAGTARRRGVERPRDVVRAARAASREVRRHRLPRAPASASRRRPRCGRRRAR